MSDSLIALAVFEGFWGQVFEYWPFFLTVGATLIFGGISILMDLWWRKKLPPPEGAMPRVEIPLDPRVPYRRWISRGRTMMRFGLGIGVFFALIYASFAINPQGINDQFALEQDRDPELVRGSLVALAAMLFGYLATVFLRDKPWVQTWSLLPVPIVAMVGPWLFTGDITKLFASAGVVGTPCLFAALGWGYTYYGLQGLRNLQRAQSSAAPAADSG